MGDAGGEHARLAGAGTRQHEDGALGGLDGQTLLGVQACEIIRWAGALPGRHGAGGNAGDRRRAAFAGEGLVVRKIGHPPECSDSGAKGQTRNEK